jgi:fermentation-respiration switch protein FrsA (DUF1100 family)
MTGASCGAARSGCTRHRPARPAPTRPVRPRSRAGSLARYAPAEVMDRLAMPVLACVGDRDQDIPVDYAQAVVARAPKGQLRRYPGSHFELYYGPLYEQVVADQLQFLRAHLVTAAAA